MVAGQNCDHVPVPGVDRGHAAPKLAFVDHVVVQEACGMDELDGHSGVEQRAIVCTCDSAKQEHQLWPGAFGAERQTQMLLGCAEQALARSSELACELGFYFGKVELFAGSSCNRIHS